MAKGMRERMSEMETNASVELTRGGATSDVGPTFEPAFYKLGELAEVPLREGVAARFVAGGGVVRSFVPPGPRPGGPPHGHPPRQPGHLVRGSMAPRVGRVGAA